MNKPILLLVAALALTASADAIRSKNARANRLYEKKQYEEALKLYDDALLEAPGNAKLSMNKGSTHYKMGEIDKAIESYERALHVNDDQAKADLFYNAGNAHFLKGEQMIQGGGAPQAMEEFKAARENYINALDLRPSDKDAKWNLELANFRIKEFEQQQQNEQCNNPKDNQDNKRNNNKDKQNQDKQDQDKQDQDKQDQDKQDQDKQDQNEQDQQKRGESPKPGDSGEELEKKEAIRLLGQYADDDKELNKPKKKMLIRPGDKPEKDW